MLITTNMVTIGFDPSPNDVGDVGWRNTLTAWTFFGQPIFHDETQGSLRKAAMEDTHQETNGSNSIQNPWEGASTKKQQNVWIASGKLRVWERGNHHICRN